MIAFSVDPMFHQRNYKYKGQAILDVYVYVCVYRIAVSLQKLLVNLTDCPELQVAKTKILADLNLAVGMGSSYTYMHVRNLRPMSCP